MPRKPAAPEDLSAKKALALEVIARLKKEYPDAACTLDYDHAWQLLVSVRLAAQCTDARVNIVVEDLFAKYPSAAALAAAEPEEIEAIVKPAAGDQIVEINFEKVGIKKTMANFAPLTKITTEE